MATVLERPKMNLESNKEHFEEDEAPHRNSFFHEGRLAASAKPGAKKLVSVIWWNRKVSFWVISAKVQGKGGLMRKDNCKILYSTPIYYRRY